MSKMTQIGNLLVILILVLVLIRVRCILILITEPLQSEPPKIRAKSWFSKLGKDLNYQTSHITQINELEYRKLKICRCLHLL